jgi:isopentenyldiphosphate isomerase
MNDERFDIYDEQLNPIGTASRREVHAKGYWHKSFHCWLVRRDNDRQLVRFQKRQSGKDTYPGYYDITAAGHLSAGETIGDAAREIEEELGISASFAELLPLGEFRKESASEAAGVPFIDREISFVYGLRRDVPLDAFRLQAEEVAGIYEIELGEIIALFDGRLDKAMAQGLELLPGGVMHPVLKPVTAAEFVPENDGYYASIFRLLQACF